ncbi:MAG TPA: hypothetical protein VMD47_10600 [Candidatus Acidoferrales bacterium]|nr:hypothetical protein [Candidatus Acidoferrales bacterium]
MITNIARVGMTAAVIVLAATTFALAETTATPATQTVAQATPSPSPNPFTYHGYVRAYDFTRQNAYSSYGVANGLGGKANQSSENNAISLSAAYRFEDSGFSVGGSYLYANPLNNCSNPALASSTSTGPCGVKSNPPATFADTTLPQFEMSTLYEAYLKYNANGLNFQGGDMAYGTPWTPTSDSRLKPVAYQGADVSYKVTSNWTVEAADWWQWECRTCSNFDHGTLLTAVAPGGYTYSGATAYSSLFYDPSETTYTNNGVIYGRIGYNGPKDIPLTANVYYYDFQNIANMFWLDAKYPLGTSRLKPFLAIQGGTENAPSSDLVGKVDAAVFGAQAGFYPMSNVLLTGAFDTIPVRTDTDQSFAGITCNAQHQFATKKSYNYELPYWVPAGGTAECTADNAAGTVYDVYYGGLASPYTDSYATDPLYTASGTQSMTDRRSPGSAFKLQATFTSDNKQFWLQVGQTWYDYTNPGYATSTNATDYDMQYFFMKVPKTGLYKGLSLRVRLFSRSETNWFGATQIPGLFKYDRFQLEYNF